MSTSNPTQQTPRDPSVDRPFYRLLGLKNDPSQTVGRSELIFDPQEQFTNSRGEVHGGVVATLLDAAMAVACRSSCGEGAAATTVSMTVNYLRPAQGRLYARGRTVRSGSTLASMEASVADESGAVVAQAIGTMRIIRAKMNAKEAHPLTDGSGPS